MRATRCTLVILAAAVVGVAAASSGTLPVRGQLLTESLRGDYCPPGTRAGIECFRRDGQGVVRGLGRVIASYVYFADTTPAGCPEGSVKILAYPTRLTVAAKGDLTLALEETPGCLSTVAGLSATQRFTITDGSGAYAGATGGGSVERALGSTDRGAAGIETWIATLDVPGLDFDVTPPVVSGAVSKTIRVAKGVKRVRVTYRVTAVDGVDGARPVACQPRSLTFFKLGRTAVTCTAGDTSANTRTVRFFVTVKTR